MGYNTIKIKKYLDIVEEYVAVAAITPGMLIELTSAGKVQAHSTAGGSALPMFALENDLEGEDILDNFAADDRVQCWIPTRGDIVYAIVADGEDIDIGDFLESNGDGMLREYNADVVSSEYTYTDYASQIIGVALEDVDLSGSSGEESSGDLGYDKRILVRII